MCFTKGEEEEDDWFQKVKKKKKKFQIVPYASSGLPL